MSTIPWEQVREIMDSVLDLPQEERSRFLDQACPDPSVRRYVDSLVLSFEEAGDFLKEPAIRSSTSPASSEECSWQGRRVGPYQLSEEIGEGGMGSVYRALRVDDQYQKQVAIKVVRRGLDTRFALSRFRAERQILANLEHPNIARLLDGGSTDDGQPYFVMEFIQGKPLEEYCDDHKLTISERLQLFRTACSAVQYAHQNLVIHRDIKPSNILVTADGIPKLLDFGIAKILSPDAPGAVVETSPMMRLLTPEYASPEQLLDEPVTTASDVYSLGVVLYELLTGRRPHRITSRNPQELARIVTENEPEKPSAIFMRVDKLGGQSKTAAAESISSTREGSPEKLRRRLSGDLDNIVLTALRRETNRRYANVEQFSEDIRRHLEGLPVSARRDTFGYRSGKFIRRHTVAVIASGIVLLSLTTGLIVSIREARIARMQSARAERRFNDVRTLANSLIFEIHDAVQDLPGSTPVRKLIVDRGLQYLDSLAKESANDASLQRELAVAYEKIGRVQGNTAHGSLGDSTGALASYNKAMAIRRTIASSASATPDDRLGLARSYSMVGRFYLALGKPTEALDFTRQSVVIAEGEVKNNPQNKKALIQLQDAYDAFGDVLSSNGNSGGLGQLVKAEEVHDKAVKLGEQRIKQFPDDVNAPRALAVALVKVGNDQQKTGRPEEALNTYTRVRDIFEQLSTSNPTNATLRRYLAGSYSAIGDAQGQIGNFTGMLDAYKKVLSMNQSAAAADPKNQQAQVDLALAYDGVGVAQYALGQFAAAKPNLTAAQDIAEKLANSDSANADMKNLRAFSEVDLGYLEERLGATASALRRYHFALQTWQTMAAASPNDMDTTIRVASVEDRIGEVLTKTGNLDEAMIDEHNALDVAQKLTTDHPSDEEPIYVVAESFTALGDASVRAAERKQGEQSKKNWSEACSDYAQAGQTWRAVRHPSRMSPAGFETLSSEAASSGLARCNAALSNH